MTRTGKTPGIWELLGCFKKTCNQRGWQTSTYENMVKVDDKYHCLIGTRTANPFTFEVIASNKKSAIPEGRSYRVVRISYAAWVFQQQPPERIVRILATNSELSRENALYDLSSFYRGKPLCLKLNETASIVFSEFEKFLEETYGMEIRQLQTSPTDETAASKSDLLMVSPG